MSNALRVSILRQDSTPLPSAESPTRSGPGQGGSLSAVVASTVGSSSTAPSSPVGEARPRSNTTDGNRLSTMKRSGNSVDSLSDPNSENKGKPMGITEPQSKQKKFSLKSLRRSKMERLVLFLQTEGSGLQIRDRTRRLTTYPACFGGEELIETLVSSCGFFSKEEAFRYCKALTEDGYLVPVEGYRSFTDDGSLFRIQTSYFWPSRNWKPTDFDYSVYLHKRVLKGKKDYQLEPYELERYEKLKKNLSRKWGQIQDTATSQLDRSKTLNKVERKVLDSQERGFWWVVKPPIEALNTFKDIEVQKKALKVSFETEESLEFRLTGEALLNHLNKRLQRLNGSLNITRVKVSVAAKSLLQRCEVYQFFDPLVRADASKNAWFMEEPDKWIDHTTPNTMDAKKWTLSLKDLLLDTAGRELFEEFLKSEFSQENLNFYLAVQDIDETAGTREEYASRCLHIYKRYIRANSPLEVNITSAVRSNVKKHFEDDAGNFKSIPELKKNLEEGCLDEAQRAVYTLMSKDSYMRFIQSKAVQDLISSTG